ncbi:MAG: heme ABC transporter ATP-binding protein [Bacteroidota bacterium]
MMFQAAGISKFIRQKCLLDRCSLDIKPGTFVAVVGPNGAGKSTLLKAMAGESKPSSGEIKINGKPLQKYSPKELSRVRAILPQFTFVNFPFTVRQVIEIGRYAHDPKENTNQILDEILELTGLAHFAERSYQTLSGGEQKRVQMARIIAQLWGNTETPRYALLDEPTASLDLAQQHELLGLAKQLCQQNIGVLAILHDLNLAIQYADEILFLKQGKTMAYGACDQCVTQEIIEETFAYPVRLLREEGQLLVAPLPKTLSN